MLNITANGYFDRGVFYFIGGLLMLLSGILEFILGNTFTFVVLGSFGMSVSFPRGIIKNKKEQFQNPRLMREKKMMQVVSGSQWEQP